MPSNILSYFRNTDQLRVEVFKHELSEQIYCELHDDPNKVNECKSVSLTKFNETYSKILTRELSDNCYATMSRNSEKINDLLHDPANNIIDIVAGKREILGRPCANELHAAEKNIRNSKQYCTRAVEELDASYRDVNHFVGTQKHHDILQELCHTLTEGHYIHLGVSSFE